MPRKAVGFNAETARRLVDLLDQNEAEDAAGASGGRRSHVSTYFVKLTSAFSTTITEAVDSIGTHTVTVDDLTGITPGLVMTVSGGEADEDEITITSIDADAVTITAAFADTHLADVTLSLTSLVDGRYQGKRYSYDPIDNAFTGQDDIWIVFPNDEPPAEGVYYPAYRSGPVEGKLVWLAIWQPANLTQICLKDCNGVEYCAWIPATIGPCEPSSGPQTGCGGCSTTADTYCTSFSGVTNSDCTGCEALASLITLTRTGNVEDCKWTFTFEDIDICPDPVTIELVIGEDVATLTVYVGGVADVTYTSAGVWDCVSAVVLTLTDGPNTDSCSNWPATITLGPCNSSVLDCEACDQAGGIPDTLDAIVDFPPLGVMLVTLTRVNPGASVWQYTSGTPFTADAFSVNIYCDPDSGLINGQITYGQISGSPTYVASFVLNNKFTCDPLCMQASGKIYSSLTGLAGMSDTGTYAHVTIGDCSAGNPPTVNFDSDDICKTDPTFAITGTNFETTAANNIVSLNRGAVGYCSAATGTTATITFTTLPTSLGALTLVLANGNGSSAPAVQVGLVVDCSTIDCTGATAWCDSYTDTDSVAITSHGPEVGTSYTILSGSPGIYGNKAVSLDGGQFSYQFDPGETEYTWTFKFLVAPTTTDAGARFFSALFRYVDSSNYFAVELAFAPGDNTTGFFLLSKTIAGVPTNLAFGTVVINTDTEYTLTVAVDAANLIEATINGVTASATDSALASSTKMAITLTGATLTHFAPYIDDMKVIPAGAGTGWLDSFTDSNGTAIASHTGENTPGGYPGSAISGGMQIWGNKAISATIGSSPGSFIGLYFDPGMTDYTMTFKFLIAPASQDSAQRVMRAYLRADNGGVENFRITVIMGSGLDSAAAFTIDKKVGASVTTVATGTTTINSDTEYTVTVVMTTTAISATINGVTANVTDSDYSTNTGIGLQHGFSFSSTSKPSFDLIEVT